MNERTYYVYMYLTEDLKPYYVGKGTGYRIHTVHSTVSLPPRERRVFVKDCLTNEEASEFEIELILKYGRKKDGGLLENVKIREWASFKGWTHSDHAKKQISEKNRGKVRTEEHREHYRGPKTKEHAEKIRQARLGTKRNADTIKKMSDAFKGKVWTDKQKQKLNTKGKTWEEIYGIEGAMKRRKAAEQKRIQRHGEVI